MIAFAYCNTNPRLTALYTSLCEGLVANIKEVMPDQNILMVTDDTTPLVKGVNGVLRVTKTMPLMVWRLKCHQVAHSVCHEDEILFTEPDVRFRENVMHIFKQPRDKPFDVAITTRDAENTMENERINTPFTLGMTFSRSHEFWREAKMYCQTLSERDQTWFGDILSVAHVIESKKFDVETLDGAVYNHIVNDPRKETDAKALHYKGRRKSFLFPQALEGSEQDFEEAAV